MDTNWDTFWDKKTFCTIILIIYLLNILLPTESTTFLDKTSIALMVRCLVVERNDEVMNPSNNYVPTWWSIVWCACGRMSFPATHLSPLPNVITHLSDWLSQ